MTEGIPLTSFLKIAEGVYFPTLLFLEDARGKVGQTSTVIWFVFIFFGSINLEPCKLIWLISCWFL